MGAELSACGQYRYTLTRPAIARYPDTGTAAFCMLNPSTVDATMDDPTIRRCRGFAERWGCNGIVVVNLYALRSTNPHALWGHADPVGPMNDYWIWQVGRECSNSIVCAWGTNARDDRVHVVVNILREAGVNLLCLGTTKSGAPRHPLYVRGDQPLIKWEPTNDR